MCKQKNHEKGQVVGVLRGDKGAATKHFPKIF